MPHPLPGRHMFKLEWVSEPLEVEGSRAAYGQIILGDCSETFTACLDYWSPERYERQWREAAERLLGGSERSAFLTWIAPPSAADLAWWWPAWREGEKVQITEQVLFFDQLQEPFNEADPYRHVRKRHKGRRYAFWTVHLDEIRDFVERSITRGT